MKYKLISLLAITGLGLFTTTAQAQDDYLAKVFTTSAVYCPRNTAEANGQLLPISQNTALFSLIGTFYGGDGTTTFALPDLRGRAAMGVGSGPGLTSRSMGENIGAETVTLNTSQIPAHSHTVKVGQVARDTSDSDSGGAPVTPPGTLETGNTVDVHNRTAYVTQDATVMGNTGGGQSMANIQPYTTLKYCIVTVGIYPSRP